MANVTEINKGNIEELTGDGVALLDFWAPWCGPCRMLGPVLDEVQAEVGDKAVIGKINCDEEPELAAKFGVSSIPAIFITKNGETVKSFVGVQAKGDLIAAIEEQI